MLGLPAFKYHPDPLATGSVVASDAACLCCGAARGYLYEGPFYAVDDVDAICPWCIADGSAAERYTGEFTDAASIGEDDDLGGDIIDEVSQRTPGFAGWQQERWLSHCGDAAAFVGKEEAGASTTYLFRCLHCGAQDSYSDCD